MLVVALELCHRIPITEPKITRVIDQFSVVSGSMPWIGGRPVATRWTATRKQGGAGTGKRIRLAG
jgi:hypothetical protein